MPHLDDTARFSNLTNAEVSSLSSGAGFWYSKEVGNVPAINLSDGPHGLRKQDTSADHLGIAPSVPATCFPPAVALAQTWDVELIDRVGRALGEESQEEGVGILLGPGTNIKRDPRCGRNFEYFSEDPVLSGELATAWVSGLQSQGIGASLKHFAANNQEDDRMRVDAQIDPRTLREIYLRPFQKTVQAAQPWTIMCSYNKVNGTYASQNHWLLTQVLRDEWGFEGYVVSDWGAVDDRVAAVSAGLDLQMPYDGGIGDDTLTAALESGQIDRATVELAAARVARISDRSVAERKEGFVYDRDEHHALAQETASRAIVLLANEGGILPLAQGAKLAVIGEFATAPRIQGSGSSRVNATRVDVPLEELRAEFGAENVEFATGFTTEGGPADAALVQEAVVAASDADVAVLFMGLGYSQESEGFDRTHLDLPADQIELLAAVLEAQPRTVVVLTHGAVVDLTEIVGAPAILDAALLGQGGGRAIAAVLSGAVNPSGKLAETIPVRLKDVPAFGNFPGEHGSVRYGEGLYVGYRWYEERALDVAFPFGHGLSYTTFEYSDLAVSAGAGDEAIVAEVTVTNTGSVDGREIVQLYTSLEGSAFDRPVKELKAFAVAAVAAGESVRVKLAVKASDLSVWDVRRDGWFLEGGSYGVHVGASSADIRLNGSVEVTEVGQKLALTLQSTVGDLLANPAAAAMIGPMIAEGLGGLADSGDSEDGLGVDMLKMLESLPLNRIGAIAGGAFTIGQIQQVLDAVNAL
jgi:beta-glucosidase